MIESNLKMIMEKMGIPMLTALAAAPVVVKVTTGKIRVVKK